MNAMLITWFETPMLAMLTGPGAALAASPALVRAVSPLRACDARRRLITGAERLWLTSAGGSGPGRRTEHGARAADCVLS